MKSLKLLTIALTFAFSTFGMTHSTMAFAGEGHDHDEKPTSAQKQHDEEENVVVLTEQAILANGIKTERASSGTISQHDTLFGVVAPTIDNIFTIMAPYQGLSLIHI